MCTCMQCKRGSYLGKDYMGQRIDESSIQSGEPLNSPQSKICVLKAKQSASMEKVDLWI